MKRIITSCLVVLMALSALAQDDNATLSPAQWRHALAVIAQWEATDGGYGQKTEQFEKESPMGKGYTIDDLDISYSGQRKWKKTYDRLKPLENQPGSMSRVKELAGKLSKQVERDMKEYLKHAPVEPVEEIVEMPAPDEQPAPEANDTNDENAAPEPDTPQVAEAPTQPAQQAADNATDGKSHLIFDIILTLLSLGALALALMNRRELTALRRATRSEVETTNSNMQQLANDVSQHIKSLLHRVSGVEARQRQAQPKQVAQQPVKVEKNDKRPATAGQEKTEKAPKTYYLSKPGENDCFGRVSEKFEMGNSLFVLTTTDGKHGTYQVIDNRDVHKFALMMPTENLTRACSGNAIQMSSGMTRIVTDRPGEAQFENGKWRIVVKAIIHYEAN